MSLYRNSSTWVLAAGTLLTVFYGLQISEAIGGFATMLVGLGTCVVQAVSLRTNPPARRAPWHCLLGASVSFLVGIVLRPWASGETGFAALTADLFTVTGYVLTLTGLGLLLGRRNLVSHALTDGGIVCLGAGIVALELFALPAARIGNRSQFTSVLAGLYPLWDVLILLLILNLSFSTMLALPSFRLLAGSMLALLIGDVGYAWIGAAGKLTGSPLLDLPFLFGFTLLAGAALHPSRRQMARAAVRPVQAWSFSRLALIVPALAAPVVVLLIVAGRSSDDVAPALTAAVLMALLLFRAVSAVRSNSAIQRGLRHQATHDALTGLPNRTLLVDRLTGLLRDGRLGRPGPWVLFIDLDGFKLVNDHWGHDTGDALLLEVSIRLKTLAGQHTVGRMSGDEFAIVGSGPAEDATTLAAQIQRDLARPIEMPGIELVVTSSIGVAALTDQVTAEAMLRDADLAMYRAKAEGRARWSVFDTAMRQTVRDRVEIELALRQALSRRQLWVAFQPIVDCRSERLVGAEALIRWTHPIRGDIPPIEFIAVAEETGLIEAIGELVLEESLGWLAEWRQQGILPDDFRMAVNVSARQLRDQGLRLLVAEQLERHGLPGERLDLEITESIMMDGSGLMADNLSGLRALGVGLSVDDFGTGYSSLSYLNRFPVTTVKIDRSFVSGLGVNSGDEAITRAVVAMAVALDLDVIAEGVETVEQRNALRDLDVIRAQGWLWGAAERPAEFAERRLRPVGGPSAGSVTRPVPEVSAGMPADHGEGLQAGMGNS